MKMLRVTCRLSLLLLSLLSFACFTSVPIAWAQAGIITEFALPTAASFPIGITSGPGGKLWFTEADGNKIGRTRQQRLVRRGPGQQGRSHHH